MAVDRDLPQEVRERLSVAALRRCRPGRTDSRRCAPFTRQSAGKRCLPGSLPATPPLSWFIVAALPRTSRTAAGRLGRRSASRSGARTAPPAARADAASCQTDAVGPPRAHIAGTRRDASPGPPRTRSRTRRRPQRASGTRSAAGTPAPSRIVSAPPVAWNRATAGPFPDGQSSARPAPHPRRPTPWSTTSSTSFAKSRRTVRVDAAHPRSSTAPPAARRIISSASTKPRCSPPPASRCSVIHPFERVGTPRRGTAGTGTDQLGASRADGRSPHARPRGRENAAPSRVRRSGTAKEPRSHPSTLPARTSGTESRPQEQPTRTGAPVPLPVAVTVRRPDAGRPVGRGKRTGAGRSGEPDPSPRDRPPRGSRPPRSRRSAN